MLVLCTLFIIYKLTNNHKSTCRFHLFGLINQCNAINIICPVAGLERMTTGSVISALPYRATQVDN